MVFQPTATDADEPGGPSLARYLAIARRQAWPMALTLGAGLALAAAAALTLPKAYRSSAVILIQEQEIPADFVRSTVTSFADERIQVISQQVMTSATLLGLVEKHRLYERMRRFDTTEEVVERMRRDIKLDTISVDITDRRTGMKSVATIAFKLSYENERPAAAQNVANDLVSLYLNENLKTRQQRAAEASEFLAEEAERLQKSLAELDARLARLKQRSQGSLPQLADFNLQLLDRMDQELIRVDRDLSQVQQRIISLEGQLTQTQPQGAMVTPTGERVLDPKARLKLLRTQYASMSGIYAERHPDILRMRREIAALEREVGGDNAQADYREELDQVEAKLAAALDRYGADHPDVQKLRKSKSAVEGLLRESADAGAKRKREAEPDNPIWVTLQTQLQAASAEQKSLQAYRAELVAKTRGYQGRLERTPDVEREYFDVIRERENALERYRDIKGKLMKAEVAQELERGRKAERFTLIEPPVLPQRAHKPNQPAIMLFGLLLGLGAGLGTASVREALDRSVKSAADLAGRVAAPLIGSIPVTTTAGERRRRRRRVAAGIVLAMLAAGALLAAYHFFVRPLDVTWYMLLRRLRLG
jgi:uncharacterized protein involved in exopolysaccharide biosynthesis